MRPQRWFRYWRRLGASEQEAIRATEACIGRPFPRYLVSTPGLFDVHEMQFSYVRSQEQARRVAAAGADLNASLAREGFAALAAGKQWSEEAVKIARRCDVEAELVAMAYQIPVTDLEVVQDPTMRVRTWHVRQKHNQKVFRTFIM